MTQTDAFARYQKGRTYMFWGMNERDLAKSPKLSEIAFESAASEFSGIDLDPFRDNALRELDTARKLSDLKHNPTVQVTSGQANT